MVNKCDIMTARWGHGIHYRKIECKRGVAIIGCFLSYQNDFIDQLKEIPMIHSKKGKRLVAILIVVMLIVSQAQWDRIKAGIVTAIGTNLITNGSADNDLNGWTQDTNTTWNAYSSTLFGLGVSPCDLANGTDFYFDGYNSQGSTASLSQKIPITGLDSKISTGYITADLSMYNFKDPGDTTSLTLRLRFYKDASLLYTHELPVTCQDGWKKYSTSYQVPSGTNLIEVEIQGQSSDQFVGFDGIQLKLIDQSPVVQTSSATNVTIDSAQIYGNILSLPGGYTFTDYGFSYSENPDTGFIKVSKGASPTTGSYSSTLSGLASDKQYYVKSYVTDSSGNVTYGTQLSFRTLAKSNPALTADTTDNNVDNPIEITFPANPDYESSITEITCNAIPLVEGTDYDITSGKITLKPTGGNTALTTPANATVVVTATGYTQATVSQEIQAGTVNSLIVTTQPIPASTSGQAFATQPQVKFLDQYGNLCVNGPSAASVVTAAAKAGSGSWTIGGTTSNNAVGGIVTFTDLTCTMNTLGQGAITFSGSGLMKDSNSFNLPKLGGLANTVTPSVTIPCLLPAEQQYSLNLNDIIKLNKTDTGSITYSISGIINANNIVKSDSVTISGNTLSCALNPNIATGDFTTVQIKVTTEKYTDITEDLQIANTTSQIVPVISGSIATGNITYGDKLSLAGITGTFMAPASNTVVPGTIHFNTPDVIPEAGTYQAGWTFTPTDTLTYKSVTGPVAVTVAKRPITVTLDNASYTKTYGDADPVFDYHITQGEVAAGETLSAPFTYAGTNVGTYDLVANTAVNTNYQITVSNGSGAFSITKRPLTIDGAQIADKTYDGSAVIDEKDITVTFSGSASGDTINYNCTTTPYADANAGTNKNTTVTVTLTGASDTNYSLTTTTVAATGTIGLATTFATPPSPIIVTAGKEQAYSFAANTLLRPDITAPKTLGTYSYFLFTNSMNSNFTVLPNLGGVNWDSINFTVAAGAMAGGGPIGTFFLTLHSQNYQDITVPVQIFAVDRTELTVSGVSIPNKEYDGTAISVIGTPVFQNESTAVSIAAPVYHYTGTDAFYDSDQPPKDAGSYKLTISVPQDNAYYYGSIELPFTITKAPLTVKAKYKTITVGDAIPTSFEIIYSGFKNGETENTPGVFLSPVLVFCPANSETASQYPITIVPPVARNYIITTYATGTLTILPKLADQTFYTVTNTANANGWYNSDITILPTAKDGFSTMRAGTAGTFAAATTISTEAAAGNVPLYFAKGNAISNPTSFAYKLDKTPPTFSEINYNPSVSFVNGIVNYLTGSTSVSVKASDNLSGVDKVSYELIPDAGGGTAKTGTVSVGAGGVAIVSIDSDFAGMIQFSASDLAGNAAATLTSNFVIEDTAPDISISSPQQSNLGWYHENVTLEAKVCDNAQSAISGGIKKITWQYNGGTEETNPTDTIYDYTRQFLVTTEGSNSYTVTAVDYSGNTNTKTITVNLDKTAPTIQAVQSTAVDASRLYRGYLLNITATDAGGSNLAGYSIDGGATWQTGNTFAVEKTTTIAAGNIMVKDTAGNVSVYSGKDVTLTVPKIASYTTLKSDKTNLSYGDNLTLTADVTTDSGITKSLNGTVTFYLGTDANGIKIADNVALVNGKATCTITKENYKNIGNKSFYVSYLGNGDFNPSGNSLGAITVNPLNLTIKAGDITCYAGNSLPTPTIQYSGFLAGENATNALTDNTLEAVHKALDAKTAGEYEITLTGDVKAENYTINKQNGTLTINEKSDSVIVVKPTNTVVSGRPSVFIPAGSIPFGINFSNLRFIINAPGKEEKVAIAKAARGKMGNIPKSHMLYFDMSLIDIGNGNAVVQPSGRIKIVLPYPKGTDRTCTFRIVHLIHGITPERILCKNKAYGIEFSVKSLSPFIIGYTSSASQTSGSNDGTNSSATTAATPTTVTSVAGKAASKDTALASAKNSVVDKDLGSGETTLDEQNDTLTANENSDTITQELESSDESSAATADGITEDSNTTKTGTSLLTILAVILGASIVSGGSYLILRKKDFEK